MTTPGLPAGMTWSKWWAFWYGPQRGFEPGAVSGLAQRARVLTNLVPESVLRHLSTFERSRLVLLVERIGEYRSAAARGLTGRERRALRNIARGIDRIVAGGRAAAAEHAALAGRARAQLRWVEKVNLRRASPRGLFGALGVGGTVVVAALAAILAVGLYASARQASVLEAITAMNAAGGDPAAFVYGSAPENECVVDEAAARGLWWSAPDGSACPPETMRPDCSWRAPMDVPEPVWSEWSGAELERRRADWAMELAVFAAPRLQDARAECGIETGAQTIWPVPDGEELCSFLPGGFTRKEAAAAIDADDLDATASCIAVDDLTAVRVWAELYAVDAAAADESLSNLSWGFSGPSEQWDIGDRGWLIRESRRHIAGGVIGPVVYTFRACSECDGARASDLPALARHVVAAYLDWAGTEG